MTHRERLLNTLDYRPVDRAVYGVWTGWWPETDLRWRGEGYDPAKAPYYHTDPWDWQGGWFFPTPPFARIVAEETEETITYVNYEGILMCERKDQPWSSMPRFIKHPVDSREGFLTYFRERMQPDLAARIGHGIGITAIEPPNIAEYEDTLLEPGMVITIEPGIYLAGRFGIRIEDMVAVTRNGGQVLTPAPKALIEL